MSYLGRLQNQLGEKDLKRFIERRPSKKPHRGHPDGRSNPSGKPKFDKTADAGQIDFYKYGGKKSKETEWEEMLRPFTKGQEDKNADQTREDWKKVASELGIKKVDSENDVLQMIKYVRGYKKEDDKPVEPKTTDPTLKPYGNRIPYGNKPVDDQPRTSESSTGSAAEDASMAAIRGGDDLNAWYQTKFVPHLEADANATNSEIGDDSRYFLKNFAFEPPKLGSIKDIFDRYKGEIEDL